MNTTQLATQDSNINNSLTVAAVRTRCTLLKSARNGDRDALAQLVMPYAPGLYRSGLRLTGNSFDAEDVRQETLLKTFCRLDQFVERKPARMTSCMPGFPASPRMLPSMSSGAGAKEKFFLSISPAALRKIPSVPKFPLASPIRNRVFFAMKTAVCSPRPSWNYLPICAVCACCSMSCIVPLRKWRSAWASPAWRCACVFFALIAGSAKNLPTRCGPLARHFRNCRLYPKPAPPDRTAISADLKSKYVTAAQMKISLRGDVLVG